MLPPSSFPLCLSPSSPLYCCHPWGRHPNRFPGQSLLKARVLFWIPPIKGEPVANARAGGDFCRVVFLGDRQPTLTVVGEHEGRVAWTTRTFQLTD